MNSYNSEWTTDASVTVKYFNTLTDAQNNTNAISGVYTANATATVYVRLEKQGFCPELAQLKFSIKNPKKTEGIKDQYICPDALAYMDAGSGFDAYLWSNGATTQTVSLAPGAYWVEVTSQGCKFRQYFKVHTFSPPVIGEIKIDADGTVTVYADTEHPPLEYSLNGSTWQESPVFPKLPSGDYIIYVRSKDACRVLQEEITVLQLINAITPNNDGYNDTLDYSFLTTKENPKMDIYDRYYALVFKGTKENNFTWNGKYLGKNINTDTYWAVIEWTHPIKKIKYSYSFWVLVKNRN